MLSQRRAMNSLNKLARSLEIFQTPKKGMSGSMYSRGSAEKKAPSFFDSWFLHRGTSSL